jgi:ABC-type phosphate transport system permease subunit
MKWTLADVWGVLAFFLMMAGIAGLSWETFRDDGWGERLLGATWQATMSKPMVMIPVLVGAVAVYVLSSRGRLAVGKGHPFSDAIVYALMALGVYFIYRLATV